MSMFHEFTSLTIYINLHHWLMMIYVTLDIVGYRWILLHIPNRQVVSSFLILLKHVCVCLFAFCVFGVPVPGSRAMGLPTFCDLLCTVMVALPKLVVSLQWTLFEHMYQSQLSRPNSEYQHDRLRPNLKALIAVQIPTFQHLNPEDAWPYLCDPVFCMVPAHILNWT